MLKEMLYVGLGGGAGSILRFLTSKIVAKYAHDYFLFLGTFAANIIGCFLIGVLSGWMLANQPDNQPFRLLFIVGFCGGYTTFSTFAFENLRLLELGQWTLLLGYTLFSVVLGIFAAWAGMKIGA
ncbi:fluoride efflux transporter CrcB [Petrimonas sulfuriphila]|jgi:CrcB protein|uniref:fluoride efflux transporter CrcB n=1 Tax=Petrimonas sulfuriphila TaxID=285070 RepID=UPI00324E7D51|nr:fluoride efflux transporter CrcB [Petrimonas sp.]